LRLITRVEVSTGALLLAVPVGATIRSGGARTARRAHNAPPTIANPARRCALTGRMPIDQTVVPRSFFELFVPPGRLRPTEPREVIAARYELCEDLAQMLTETAQARRLDLGITGADVLERLERGLLVDDSPVEPDEARWVVRRLAELLGWPDPYP
jgi:hypothetical protein